MRLLALLTVVILTIMDFAPFPITGLILIWIVLFRPMWFYRAVQNIYRDLLRDETSDRTSPARGRNPHKGGAGADDN